VLILNPSYVKHKQSYSNTVCMGISRNMNMKLQKCMHVKKLLHACTLYMTGCTAVQQYR